LFGHTLERASNPHFEFKLLKTGEFTLGRMSLYDSISEIGRMQLIEKCLRDNKISIEKSTKSFHDGNKVTHSAPRKY
jgi:hypothetical protein